MDEKQALDDVYSNPRNPGSFSGVDKLKRSVAKVKKIHISIKPIKNWLKSKDTYTKYRVSRKNFKRNPVIAPYIDAQWQGDLAEVGNLADENDGVRYLLILIDVVSKYIWVEPLKTKSGPSVLTAFKKVFAETDRKPIKLQTDDGKEFWFRGLQTYLKKEKIKFFTLKSDKKAALAERVIRTLKEKIYRYMHEKNTARYIDVLKDLVASYNETYHKSIKMAPVDVNYSNEGQVLRTLYGHNWGHRNKRKKPKFQKDDFVRISGLKKVFSKGYMGNWSSEVYIVDGVIRSYPKFRYRIRDWKGEVLEGTFYEEELQLVHVDMQGYWKIEKILEKKKVGRKTMYFVKWLGHDSSLNSWVNEKDIKALKQGG